MNLRDKLPYFLKYAQKKSDEPIFVEYLESTGGQYIDTGVFPDNTYTFDSSVALTQEKYNCVYWGVRSEGNWETLNKQCYLNSNLASGTGINRLVCLYSTSALKSENWSSGIEPAVYEKYELTGMTVVPTMEKMTYPVILFGLNNIGSINTAIGMCRIYRWTAYSNGKTVMDLRPCLHHQTGEPCMYDMVSKKYYMNQGTGEFKYEK